MSANCFQDSIRNAKVVPSARTYPNKPLTMGRVAALGGETIAHVSDSEGRVPMYTVHTADSLSTVAATGVALDAHAVSDDG